MVEAPLLPKLHIIFKDGKEQWLLFESWDDMQEAYDHISGNPSEKSFRINLSAVRITIYTEHIMALECPVTPEKQKRS